MGIGDELMAAGHARRVRQTDPRRVHILNRHGVPRWHEVWENNPSIARPDEEGDFQTIVNAPKRRPYIESLTPTLFVWKEYECTPAELVFSEQEREFAARQRAPLVVIEPTIKSSASSNKDWGQRNWLRLIAGARAAGIRFTQLRPLGFGAFPDVDVMQTPDFRRACAILARAKLYVGHEGGMHHAAAALGIPAIVIFGGFISPAQTGYKEHHNFFTGGVPCGRRLPCDHCRQAMAAITPAMVLAKIKEVLQ